MRLFGSKKRDEAGTSLKDQNTSTPEEKIHNAAIAGYVSAGLTALAIVASFFGIKLLGIDIWAIIDVLLIVVLSYGTSRNSRFCAVAMFIYFIISKAFLFYVAINEGARLNIWTFIVTLSFLIYFWGGVTGTFQIKKNTKKLSSKHSANPKASDAIDRTEAKSSNYVDHSFLKKNSTTLIFALVTLLIGGGYVGSNFYFKQKDLQLRQQQEATKASDKKADAEKSSDNTWLRLRCMSDADRDYDDYLEANGTKQSDGTYWMYNDNWDYIENKTQNAKNLCLRLYPVD